MDRVLADAHASPTLDGARRLRTGGRASLHQRQRALWSTLALTALAALGVGCQTVTPCTSSADCERGGQCVSGFCVLLDAGAPDAGAVDAGGTDAGADAGQARDAGACEVELQLDAEGPRQWDESVELVMLSTCESTVVPQVRIVDGGAVEVQPRPCRQCSLSVCRCFTVRPWTAELPGRDGTLEVTAGDAGARLAMTRLRWTAQLTGSLVSQPVVTAEGDLVLGVQDGLGVALWRLRTLEDGGVDSSLRQLESFNFLTELVATEQGVTVGYGMNGMLTGVWTDGRRDQTFALSDDPTELSGREWTLVPGLGLALPTSRGLQVLSADGGLSVIPLRTGEQRTPTSLAHGRGATVYAQYASAEVGAIVRFDVDAGVALPALDTQQPPFEQLLPHPTVPFPAMFGVSDAGIATAVGGEGRLVVGALPATPALSLLDGTRLLFTQPGRELTLAQVESPLSVFGGSAITLARTPLEPEERPVAPLIAHGHGEDWVYVWSGTLRAIQLSSAGTASLAPGWTAAPLTGALRPAELALDCPRNNAEADAPGVLYVTAEDPVTGVVRVAAVLVEAQRLSGAWPKYRRTAGNAGNLDGPLHLGCQ